MDVEIKRDGLTLHGLLETPAAKTYDIAVLMHGFTGNLGYDKTDLLAEVARTLQAQGLATIRFDFNGCGKSDGRFQDMTIPSEIADGKAILDYTRKLPHIRHIYLVGHSQGGVVASMLAGYYPEVITRLVLLAPAATLKDDALKGNLMGVTYNPKKIPETLNLREDVVVGGFYLRTAQMLPIYEVAQRYRGPVCVIHGDADTVVDKIASKRYHAVYDDSELHIIAHGTHQFQEAARPQVLRIVSDFLQE
ncbi:alpha/beta hydrolase [Pediococcus siamensis]|uniref:alpha/beta hydrolase n=1 Tax=Pediococcus siamensis TaxID=381829 RepID=UPI0039A20D82